MLPWVQVYTNIVEHPKTMALVEALDIKSASTEPEMVAVGMLIGLWTWAAKNAYSGDLDGVSNRVIAKACGWKKSPDKLVDALINCGLLDDNHHIHDWEEYAELFINRMDYQREQNRKRAKEHRDRKKIETENNGYEVQK